MLLWENLTVCLSSQSVARTLIAQHQGGKEIPGRIQAGRRRGGRVLQRASRATTKYAAAVYKQAEPTLRSLQG